MGPLIRRQKYCRSKKPIVTAAPVRASRGAVRPCSTSIRAGAYRNSLARIGIDICTFGRRVRRSSVVIDVDVVYVNMDECTAYCSDGVTRPFHEMYDACAELTQDPDEAMVAIVKIAEDKFIMLGLVGEEAVSVH